ncbi:MAG: chorismate lyase [Pseudomonadales bacterium]|nr:chorismate lyase [Pseudomonadales bacterium]
MQRTEVHPAQGQIQLPPQWRPWLLDRGSLTQRLIELSQGHFSVRVLNFQFDYPSLNERKQLKLPERRVALIREVELLCRNIPAVYARSIIPLNTLTGKEKQLRKLGKTPLGAVLFRSKAMHRGPITLCHERVKDIPGLRARQNRHIDAEFKIWGRSSLFFLHEKPILVAEYFLPELLSLIR